MLGAAKIGKVSVFDFSSRMCSDLAAELEVQGVSAVSVFRLDITKSIPSEQRGQFDLVVSDRLINRLTEDECLLALHGMSELLAPGGEIRTSVKLGLYPMDEKMLVMAGRAGIASNFFDSVTNTIDYAKAGELLESCIVAHGDIPRDSLLQWYRGRGKEKRYSADDVVRISEAAVVPSRLIEWVELPDAPSTRLYILR
ncbi:hypothetical protein PRtIB026_A28980 [Pseudomonas sp. RtIB026]|nr:hypothetical protein PRtIB026_A28980 [Pseudomonas sp. RtIB026]